MKGTIFDFLKLAAESPELSRELGDLAAKYDFEFTDEVSDDELEAVAGGNVSELSDLQLLDLQQQQQDLSQVTQTFSSILKQWHDTSKSIINNLRA